jgi:gas vesicle protein
MASSSGSNRGLFIVAGLIVGLVLGALVGYSLSNVQQPDSSQIANLQQQISSLQNQLSDKNAQISNLQQQIANLQNQISNLQSQLESKNTLISSLQEENSNLQNQTTYLQNEIERLMNTTRIVQSEEYLLQMTGAFSLGRYYRGESTYFTTLGRQIKIDAKLTASVPVYVKFGFCYVHVYYVYEGAVLSAADAVDFHFDYSVWDFGRYSELNDTLYIKLLDIPEQLFGKVPLFIEIHLSLDEASYSNIVIFFEVKAYDVYPP